MLGDETAPQAAPAAIETRHPFEFHGSGSAYFRIWIVNLALTVLTLGIFGAWAKVRTRRYFNGSTWVAGHSFDYHASGLKILIGRTIALGLMLAYSFSVHISPLLGIPWFLIGLYAYPWLVNSSIRFNARNTSYRNVRFNFTATDIEALMAFVVWPIVGMVTLGLLWPLAQRQRDYFYINNHTFGGRYFETSFPAWRIYAIFGIAIGLFGFFLAVGIGLFAAAMWFAQQHGMVTTPASPTETAIEVSMLLLVYLPLLVLAPAIHTMIVNLSVSGTVFDDRHKLKSTMSPLTMAWIILTNVVLCILTLGVFYPWAKVRLARYQMEHLTLIASGDIDAYVSEVFDTQSAVGEEIGSVFAFDFGL